MSIRIRAVVVLVALVAAACGDGGGDEVRVAAASSLTEVLDGVAVLLGAEQPPLGVVVDLGGSAGLAVQLLDGSPADVFLAADETTMARVVDAGLIDGDVVDLATNRLILAVPPDNPGGVTSLDDLGRRDLFVGRCADAVPCGALALAELAESGIPDLADTEEPDVRSLLAKVAIGELDVALVYVTDVLARPDVRSIADDRLDRTTRYQGAVLADGDTAAGRRVLRALRSPAGISLLVSLGFGAA